MAWFLIKHRDYFILYLYFGSEFQWVIGSNPWQLKKFRALVRAVCNARGLVLSCPVLSCLVVFWLTVPKPFAFLERALSARRRLCTGFLCHVQSFVSEIKYYVVYLKISDIWRPLTRFAVRRLGLSECRWWRVFPVFRFLAVPLVLLAT
jgi:hypothetical protein